MTAKMAKFSSNDAYYREKIRRLSLLMMMKVSRYKGTQNTISKSLFGEIFYSQKKTIKMFCWKVNFISNKNNTPSRTPCQSFLAQVLGKIYEGLARGCRSNTWKYTTSNSLISTHRLFACNVQIGDWSCSNKWGYSDYLCLEFKKSQILKCGRKQIIASPLAQYSL